jgi:hypothetical protein
VLQRYLISECYYKIVISQLSSTIETAHGRYFINAAQNKNEPLSKFVQVYKWNEKISDPSCQANIDKSAIIWTNWYIYISTTLRDTWYEIIKLQVFGFLTRGF